MEAIRSSETTVDTTSTQHHIPENCFLHSHSRENLKSYMISLLSIKNFTSFYTFVVMLGVENLDFSNFYLIFHLNSMPTVCRRLKITDSTTQAISRLECGQVKENFKPCLLRLCENVFGMMRINLLEVNTGVGLFCWLLETENLRIWLCFCLLSVFLNELSMTAKIHCCPELIRDGLRKTSSSWIFWSCEDFLRQ
jgi:hypothetical protein